MHTNDPLVQSANYWKIYKFKTEKSSNLYTAYGCLVWLDSLDPQPTCSWKWHPDVHVSMGTPLWLDYKLGWDAWFPITTKFSFYNLERKWSTLGYDPVTQFSFQASKNDHYAMSGSWITWNHIIAECRVLLWRLMSVNGVLEDITLVSLVPPLKNSTQSPSNWWHTPFHNLAHLPQKGRKCKIYFSTDSLMACDLGGQACPLHQSFLVIWQQWVFIAHKRLATLTLATPDEVSEVSTTS